MSSVGTESGWAGFFEWPGESQTNLKLPVQDFLASRLMVRSEGRFGIPSILILLYC